MENTKYPWGISIRTLGTKLSPRPSAAAEDEDRDENSTERPPQQGGNYHFHFHLHGTQQGSLIKEATSRITFFTVPTRGTSARRQIHQTIIWNFHMDRKHGGLIPMGQSEASSPFCNMNNMNPETNIGDQDKYQKNLSSQPLTLSSTSDWKGDPGNIS